ncbi:hypothetical protein LX87_05216 [Larkinella arboricola]|uniref:Uncharacterized protein n=1 Tax=Larkinella arboricola TaxID=643671 RepID=A0A327WN39_LARAB|nr:hypothetical protein [Larkinella arboricola]RAJ92248.1 hypothetical protein LX87_05216 [Larkinella arboricola]
MFLYFSYLCPDGYEQRHHLHSQDIEEIHLDTLNCFIAFGFVLQSAYLIDEQGCRTHLPLEAFDGWPMAHHLQKLQEQYQGALIS